MEPNELSFSIKEAQDNFGLGPIHDAFLTAATELMRGATVLAAAPPSESKWAFALVSGEVRTPRPEACYRSHCNCSDATCDERTDACVVIQSSRLAEQNYTRRKKHYKRGETDRNGDTEAGRKVEVLNRHTVIKHPVSKGSASLF